MSGWPLRDLPTEYRTQAYCGMVSVEVPACSTRLLQPMTSVEGSDYSPYKRVP